MANVEHRDMVSADVHEPKGISDSTAADAGKVITPLSGGTSELRNLTPAEVGVEFIYGEMKELESAETVSITAATDTNLYTGSDYTLLNSAQLANVIQDQSNGVTFNATNNTLVVPVAGDYKVSTWFNVSSDTLNSLIGLKYTVNGSVIGDTVKSDVKDSGRTQNIGGHGHIALAVGDEVGIAIACDKTAVISVKDFVATIQLLKAA